MIARLRPSFGMSEFLTALLPSSATDVERFEKRFAQMADQAHAIAFPYGRTGLLCLLEAMGLRDREIIGPAWTCVVVPHAVVKSGNEPVFVDSNPHDYNMDLSLAGKEVTDKTGAMVATSIFGHPVNLDELDRFRYKYPSLPVIQDCAHSFLCTWNNRPVHKEGIAAIYGLNISKLMTSIFGGMITTDDDALAEKLRQIRSRVIQPAPWIKNWHRRAYLVASTLSLTPPVYGAVNALERWGGLNRFVKYYDESVIDLPADWNIDMSPVEARVGTVQCDRYASIISHRRRSAALYRELLKNIPGIILPPHNEGATYSHFTILVENRPALLEQALAKGIQLGWLIEYSIPEMKAYRHRSGYRAAPVANELAGKSVNLPLWCGAKQIRSVVGVFHNILSR